MRDAVGIYELGQAVAYTLDLNTILDKVADAALQQCDASEVSIMLPTQGGEALYVAAVRGADREHILGERVPIVQGVAGWVAQHGEPLHLEGAVADARFAPTHPRPEIRSAISYPLVLAGNVIGVLNLSTRHRRGFTLGQVKSLGILAGIAAAALVNASLYREARQAEARYRSIFDTAPQGIYQATADGRLLTANAALARMLGYESPEHMRDAVTLLAHHFYAESDRAEELARLLDASGRVVRLESRARRADGATAWISETVQAAKDAAGALLAYESCVEDVTERRAAEEALRESEERLRQAQKLESLGQLAGGIAHDFNNLLTAIIGFGNLLRTQVDLPGPQGTYLDEIVNAGERAAALTRQLLAFSRRQVLQYQVLDLNEVIVGIDQLLQRVLGEDVDLVTLLAPSVGHIRADRSQLEQVIVNLAVNARDAMPGGGKLTIETDDVALHEQQVVQHPGSAAGPYVMLAVTDTGMGMDPETQERIFEPFFTTKEPGKGTGMGLATVYGIVQQSNGHVWVYSEPGRGTTFKIYLPMAEGEPEAPASAPASGAALEPGDETVLLVEDQAGVRALAQEVLQASGYVVLPAKDGDEALRICESHTGPVHLLLTDVVMPGMSGPDLAAALAVQRPDLRVLYMSGYTSEAAHRHGVLEQSGAYLEKPFTPRQLASKVRETLDAPRPP
ncbi:MAG: response regulator [Chloroflexi bacterium]|nr:response regulator [Chloroflexota bacterium]